MVKEPVSGRVKTRLGRDIGMVQAAWWFRRQSRSLVRRLTDPRWQLVLAVSPDRRGLMSRFWPGHVPRVPQGTGTLGDRMGRMLRSMPPGPVCVIGADIPGITRMHIVDAFASLGAHDAVFGPANDGGYWLVGAQRRRALPPSMFTGVRWSTEFALADTLATMGDARIAQVATLADIDTNADLLELSLP